MTKGLQPRVGEDTAEGGRRGALREKEQEQEHKMTGAKKRDGKPRLR
jgi:hypothetical protein